MGTVTISKPDADLVAAILGRCNPPYNTNGPGWGPATIKALGQFADAAAAGNVLELIADLSVHSVLASSFADPADVAAFQRAKAKGMTDQQAFKYGDNGIGYWDNSTVEGSGPQFALPPEDWKHLPHPQGTLAMITANGRSCVAALGDTMPHKDDITNGAGLDMNPDLCAALGLVPGGMWKATWQWLAA